MVRAGMEDVGCIGSLCPRTVVLRSFGVSFGMVWTAFGVWNGWVLLFGVWRGCWILLRMRGWEIFVTCGIGSS